MAESESSGSSTSVPINMNSAQSNAALLIQQMATQFGSQVFQWALQNYATTTAMTDQSVTNYLQMSQSGLALAQEQMAQYNNTYVPEMQQLATLAATYSSDARVAVDTGAAESASEQGSAAGLNNARANLQSYGIDPSSGMYGELEESQNAAAGAAAAGAGVTAGEATQAAGRSLLGESVQVGEQIPGDTVNDLNSAYQGVAGAENAVLANAQTGANLLDAANPFLATGASVKYPPVGTASQSSQQSSSSGPAGASANPTNKGASNQGNPDNPGNMSYNLPTDSTMGGGGNNGSNNLPVGGATDTGVGTESGGGEPNTSGDGAFSGPPDPSTYTDFENPSAYTTNEFGGDSSFAGPPAPTTGGIDMPAGGDNPSEGTSDLGSSGGINQPAPVDTSSDTPYTDPNSDDTSGGGYSPPPDSSDDYSGGDYSGGDYSGGDDSSYARGGAVQNMGIPPQRGQGGGMTTGGRVPLQASPSQGQQTDDVPARLNAGEFVVPKDVAAWKGQEFFQKLIEQSRKARLGSPAKPKAKLPLPNQHQPSFISRRMPGR